MATLAKMVTKTLDVGVSNTTIDLSATIKSFDVLDTKFIFGITSNQGLAINLSGATVKYIVEYYVEGKSYAIEGNCLVVDINTISFNLPDQLRGYNGKALIGIYATLTDGTKIDIKNIVVNIEPSLMDKGTDFKARYYFESFDNVLASVKDAGNKAISQINTVLPGVQSKVAEIDRQIRSLPSIPDLYVAYADDANGTGFSKTDNSKLFKGYSVRNSTSPSDYQWERNVDSLAKDMKLQKTVGDNLIVNGYGDFGDNTNFNNYVFDFENRYNNNPIFKINKKGTYSICNERIPIDINKSYEFSMNLKSDNGGRIYLGWVEYDIDGFNIVAKHAMGFSQTTTSLIKDLNNGDTVVYLESTSNWVDSAFMYQNGLIFWNYKDSTGYTYPEGVYSRNSWGNLYSSSDVNKSNNTIKLKEPWNKGTIPAGTKVSQTNDQGYKYRNFENRSVPQSWTHTSFEIGKDHKLQPPYQIDVTRFNPATRSISFVVLFSYQDAIADTYYINSIEFKSIDNKLLLLDANPINSILTTLSAENPSTKLGGTWIQLGNESKFGSTIYYWKRIN